MILLLLSQLIDFGRNYDLVLEEWRRITKEKEANIRVLDMPLLDTTKTEGLTGKLISDIVLQLLSYVAEQERTFIRQRQAEGIAIARAKGVKFGRPRIDRKRIRDIMQRYYSGEIETVDKAIEKANVSRGTYFRILKEFKKVGF